MNQQHVFDLAVPVQLTDHVIGASHAPVTIVEYADYQCPACAEYAPVIKQLITDEQGKVFFVFRTFVPRDTEKRDLPAIAAAPLAN